MKAFARIERLERLLRRPVRGMQYTMPDGSWRVLPFNHKGFSDALSRIDSPEARIVLNAVTDYNNGAMLKLLHAVMNPQPEETIQEDNVPVTTQI